MITESVLLVQNLWILSTLIPFCYINFFMQPVQRSRSLSHFFSVKRCDSEGCRKSSINTSYFVGSYASHSSVYGNKPKKRWKYALRTSFKYANAAGANVYFLSHLRTRRPLHTRHTALTQFTNVHCFLGQIQHLYEISAHIRWLWKYLPASNLLTKWEWKVDSQICIHKIYNTVRWAAVSIDEMLYIHRWTNHSEPHSNCSYIHAYHYNDFIFMMIN